VALDRKASIQRVTHVRQTRSIKKQITKKGGNKFQVSGYQKESAEKQTIMQVVRGSKQTFALMPFPSFQ